LPRAELAATVRWFQQSVVAPHEARKRRLAPASARLLPSKTLSPEQRLGIYADAYLARLVGALEEDFPATARFTGHRRFHRICREYLEKFPSRSPSLNPLGPNLPKVLAGGARDLARLEVAMSEVFDGDPAEALTPADLGRFTPGQLAGARLPIVPTFRLLALEHDANPYVDAVRQGLELPALRRKRSWVAVYRKEFQVRRLDLDEPAHAALSALRRGRTVSRAVAAAARLWKGEPGPLRARIRRWFGEWVSEGFFSKGIP
jgi:hypothetical protein